MDNESKLPLAEIKAGLKLAKEVYEVLENDTDYVKGIRLHLRRLDAALQSGELERILRCNILITKDYGTLLGRKGFSLIKVEQLEKLGLYENFMNLRSIGKALAVEIFMAKLMEGLGKAAIIGLKYFIDKQYEKVAI